MKHTPRALVLFAILFLMGGASSLFSQTTISDPSDPIYSQFDAWATRGLLRDLPQLRPYTGAMVDGLLHEVIATGSSDDALVAQAWLDALGERGFRLRSDVRVDAALGSASKSYFVGAGPGFSLNMLVGGKLGMSARVEALVSKGSTSAATPFGSGYQRDIGLEADSGVGGGFAVLQDFNSAMSYGNESIGIQAGFMRGSWGPFFEDGVVMGPQAPGSGQFTFSWRGKGISADIGFYMMQQGFGDGVTKVAGGASLYGLSGQKYMMIHGIDWSPSNWVTLGLFESVVWADRFEPLYFIPLSELFTLQSMASWGDNSFAGLSGTLYLPRNLRFDAVAYADDLNFSGILRGNFDTKWKLALQGGLSWAPPSRYVQKLSVDYTAVGPYTYTHWADIGGNGDIGALAYTNAGKNIGPALDPDSDRVTLKATSMPVEGFQATGLFRLIRHGNASAGVLGYSGATSTTANASGNLGDPGVAITGTANGVPTTANIYEGDYNTGTTPRFIRFLTQSVIEVSYQAGFTLGWTRRMEGLGRFEASAGYLFEFVNNAEVPGLGPVAGNTSVKQYVRCSVGFGF